MFINGKRGGDNNVKSGDVMGLALVATVHLRAFLFDISKL